MSATRTLACWCHTEADVHLAVLVVTPDLAARLRRKLEAAAEALAVDGVECLDFANGEVRYFNETWTDNEDGVAALFWHAERAGGDGEETDREEGWFDLGDVEPPPDGEYRTGRDQLRVRRDGIHWEAAGKHDPELFETAPLAAAELEAILQSV